VARWARWASWPGGVGGSRGGAGDRPNRGRGEEEKPPGADLLGPRSGSDGRKPGPANPQEPVPADVLLGRDGI